MLYYLRPEAKLQFDSLTDRCPPFRESVGRVHRVVLCRARRLVTDEKYQSRCTVHTVTVPIGGDTRVEIDFRIKDGPRVVVESYHVSTD